MTRRKRLIRFPVPRPDKPASKTGLQHTSSTLAAGSKDPMATARGKRYTQSKQLGLATALSQRSSLLCKEGRGVTMSCL